MHRDRFNDIWIIAPLRVFIDKAVIAVPEVYYSLQMILVPVSEGHLFCQGNFIDPMISLCPGPSPSFSPLCPWMRMYKKPEKLDISIAPNMEIS